MGGNQSPGAISKRGTATLEATVANTLTSLIPKVISRGLPALRANAVTPRLATDYSFMIGGPGHEGNVLTIPTGATQAVATVTPGPTAPANVDHTAGSVSLTIDTHEDTRFHLTDQELSQIAADDTFVPLQMEMAFKAMGDNFDAALLALYVDIYGAAGTPGTAPFASSLAPWTGSTGGRKILMDQLSPVGPWGAVLDPAAEGNLLANATLLAANSRGTDEQVRTGRIGTALGVDWNMNQNVPTHTVGTLTNGTGMLAKVNDAAYTVGESTVDIDDTSLSGTVVAGDIFSVAGDTQTYAVTAGATAATNALAGMAFAPTSQVAWANNAVVTFLGGATGGTNHVANMVMHPGAFGYAFGTPPNNLSLNPTARRTVRDSVTGIPLRVRVVEQHYQTTWYIDYIYGVNTIRKELAVRLAG